MVAEPWLRYHRGHEVHMQYTQCSLYPTFLQGCEHITFPSPMYAVLARLPPGHEVHMQAGFPHVVRGAPFVFCKGVNISLSQVESAHTALSLPVKGVEAVQDQREGTHSNNLW